MMKDGRGEGEGRIAIAETDGQTERREQNQLFSDSRPHHHHRSIVLLPVLITFNLGDLNVNMYVCVYI